MGIEGVGFDEEWLRSMKAGKVESSCVDVATRLLFGEKVCLIVRKGGDGGRAIRERVAQLVPLPSMMDNLTIREY